MATKDFSKGVHPKRIDGTGMRIAILTTRWNESIITAMKEGCERILKENGVTDIINIQVPGAYELPFAAKSIITREKNIDAVVALGCLIKGETSHFEYICEAVTQGICRVGLDSGVPVIFGVLTVHTEEQAKARAGLTEKGHNHGEDYGYAAIEMGKMKFSK